MDEQSQMRMSTKDLEKDGPSLMPTELDDESTLAGGPSGLRRHIKNLEHSLAHYNLEARGIQRVMPNERHSLRNLGYSQVGLLWFSVNLAANNITLGMLGPAVYYLSFLDCSLCAVFGMLVGCL
ncbi:hypothetical protein KCU77_g20484, partial [Aureobasidium melanogenum]